MPVIRESVETTLSQQQAFEYVAMFENIVDWDPGVRTAVRTTDHEGVGAAYDLELSYGTSSFEMTYVVIEYASPDLVVLEGDGARSTAIDRISFRQSPHGTTIDYEAEIELKGVYRLAQPFLGSLFARVGEGARAGLHRRLAQVAAAQDAPPV